MTRAKRAWCKANGYLKSGQHAKAIYWFEQTSGDLEKLNSRTSECSLDVNFDKSKREQSGINRRQFCGARQRTPIFRGPLLCILSEERPPRRRHGRMDRGYMLAAVGALIWILAIHT